MVIWWAWVATNTHDGWDHYSIFPNLVNQEKFKMDFEVD